jgi:hypothetical protein
VKVRYGPYVHVPHLSRRLRNELYEAPSTSRELSVVLAIPLRTVQVGLWILTSQGHARVAGVVPGELRRGPRLKLYKLTPAGRYMVRKAAA